MVPAFASGCKGTEEAERSTSGKQVGLWGQRLRRGRVGGRGRGVTPGPRERQLDPEPVPPQPLSLSWGLVAPSLSIPLEVGGGLALC